MKLKVYNVEASTFQEEDFPLIPLFQEDEGVQALRQVLIAFRANLRQGNACAKMRGEVSGTGKKPWKQKGTGMARHGSRRSPIWYKGGVVFGPRPRDYSQKINKKVKTLALARALFDSASRQKLRLIDAFDLPAVKTARFAEIVSRIVPEGKVLIVDKGFSNNVLLSARNIQRLHMQDALSLNPYDLVEFNQLVMTRVGLSTLLTRLGEE